MLQGPNQGNATSSSTARSEQASIALNTARKAPGLVQQSAGLESGGAQRTLTMSERYPRSIPVDGLHGALGFPPLAWPNTGSTLKWQR